mmetsp:Transcript_3269/g.2818  ORF Transcript_3269/g.2818 Transcript_3269/m.2818 type:complete len:86 (+) Transcript_3269:1-258(+)
MMQDPKINELSTSRRPEMVAPKRRSESMFRLPDGFFKLPPNFRKYSKFISYGWGGFAVVGTVAVAGRWVQQQIVASDTTPTTTTD